jgi:hypothetical protein
MNETKYRKQIQVSLSEKGIRLFRNNVGLLYAKDGTLVRVGLAKGSGDLIGWKPTVITQEMVGKTIAVFLSIETKSKKGKSQQEQKDWLKTVNESGGIAVISSPNDDINEQINL